MVGHLHFSAQILTLMALHPRLEFQKEIRKVILVQSHWLPSARRHLLQQTTARQVEPRRTVCLMTRRSNPERRQPNTACTRLVGVCAFSGTLRGLELVP